MANSVSSSKYQRYEEHTIIIIINCQRKRNYHESEKKNESTERKKRCKIFLQTTSKKRVILLYGYLGKSAMFSNMVSIESKKTHKMGACSIENVGGYNCKQPNRQRVKGSSIRMPFAQWLTVTIKIAAQFM